MNKQEELLTPSQLTFLILGFALGPEFLKLPNTIVKISGQDAWISAIIALIYPISIVLICSYIIKEFPKDSILDLSIKCYGKFIGSVLNFIFFLQFFVYSATVTTEFVRVSRIYIVAFLTPLKIALVGVVLGVFAATKGLKTLGRINEFVSYLIIIVIIFSISALKYGTLLNIQPVFQTGISGIVKGALSTTYNYTGFEVIILFHPYLTNIKKVRKSGMLSVFIGGVIWVWTTFVTIYYLGIDIIPKTNWSFIWTYESINLPAINNFRYVFMFTWTLVSLRMISNYIFCTSFILKKYIRINPNIICLILLPIVIYLSLFLSKGFNRETLLQLFPPISVIFNLIFITSIAIMVKFNTKLKSKKVPFPSIVKGKK